MNNARFSIQLYIGAKLREVTEHRLNFDDNAPGRAQLVIKGDAEANQIVAIELGWGDSVRRVFTGYIERVAPHKPGFVSLFCRELAAVLYHPLNVVMRHPTLTQLLSNVTEQTGIQFVIPNKAYANSAIPCFYSTGNGYRVLGEIGQAFGIANYIWQQQGNGQVFVGSWNDSYWSDKPITIPANLMNARQSAKSVTVPCVPAIKPGVLANGHRIVAVEHKATESTITWM